MKLIAVLAVIIGAVAFIGSGGDLYSVYDTCDGTKLVTTTADGANQTFSTKAEAQQALNVPDEKMSQLCVKNDIVYIQPESGRASEVDQ